MDADKNHGVAFKRWTENGGGGMQQLDKYVLLQAWKS